MASDRDDLTRRWREAKLGERRGGRVAVWVECAEGVDPRAEVLRVLGTEALREMQAEIAAGAFADTLVAAYSGTLDSATAIEAYHGADVLADGEREPPKPKRRKRTKGGE